MHPYNVAFDEDGTLILIDYAESQDIDLMLEETNRLSAELKRKQLARLPKPSF